MFVKFRFGHNSIIKTEKSEAGEEVKVLAISEEDYKKLRDLVPELPENPLDKENFHFSWTTYTGHLESILEIVSKIEIESVVRVRKSGMENMEEALYRINNNLREMETRLDKYKDQLLNHRVNVHVPGNALLNITEVHYEVDCCTDNLRNLMEDGWRILAVCPQPDQRRPDYILGRIGENDGRN